MTIATQYLPHVPTSELTALMQFRVWREQHPEAKPNRITATAYEIARQHVGNSGYALTVTEQLLTDWWRGAPAA